MRTVILLIFAVCVSCSPIRWILKPGPDATGLTTMERSGIIEDGWIDRGSNFFNPPASFFYSWTERLTFMKPPVKVVSMDAVSHGVFREKWRNYVLIVKDGDGILRNLGEVPLEQMAPGMVLK